MLLKVKSERGLKYVLELIEEMMRVLEIPEGKAQDIDYRMPYEHTDALLERGLVKLILPKGMTLDENTNTIKVDFNLLFGSKEDKEKVNSEPKSASVEESKIAIELPIVVEHAHVKPEEVVHVDAVHADELISDVEAEQVIEHVHISTGPRTGKLVEVNLDVICENFEDGETVTLEALKERCLINKKAGRVKILARGTMTKALTVVASKFSLQAVKMITLAGGAAEIED